MAGYIKSHSNYRLQSIHQVVDDGIILERDISTVGGVNSFATGQATVYQSGNFVIVVNNSSPASRNIRKKGWLSSGNDSDVWNEEVLSQHSSDVNGSVEKSIMLKNDFMDLRSFAYYGSLSDLIQNTIVRIVTTFPYELYNGEESGSVEVGGIQYRELSNPGKIDMHNTSSWGSSDDSVLGHFYNGGYTNYEIFSDTEQPNEPVGFEWDSVPQIYENDCPTPWKKISTITITVSEWDKTITIDAYWDDNLNIVYLTEEETDFHIRPKSDMSYYDDFVDGLDLFGKCLVGVYSGIMNTSKFELLMESDNGTRRYVKTFTIPSGPGGYNINSDSVAMRNYISELGRIGISYDEAYTDNMYRMMTHDSLKNLDWTKGFDGNDRDEETNEYIRTGEKFSSVIRIMGYVFDQEKAYIDSIGNVNTITYSNRNNLSDYFLTDAIETEGINVNVIYPYDLAEYDSDGKPVPSSQWTINNQFSNEYTRKFSENTAEIISPYEYFDGGFYTKCVNGESRTLPVPGYHYGQEYYVSEGKSYNVITDYHNTSEMTIPDINNEFMKRLKINSRYILRKKGTVEGLESILSLFGLKSNRWCDEGYDFSISETTCFTPPITDTFDNVHSMYKIDWYNSCKTISYDTQSYINGIYIHYQGLPVAYRETNGERRLYPYFQQGGIYDGNMYYQMNGGWIGYMPYRFDIEDKFLVSNGGDVRVETMRNIMQVNDITELINQPMGELYDNATYYVTDISEMFALINGYPYPVKEESVENDVWYYFEVEIKAGSVSVGGDLYDGIISVSDRERSMTEYDLSLYEDGTPLRIYYTGRRDYAFEIELGGYYPDSSLFFIDGTYNGNDSYKSHYFTLKDVSFAGLIGTGYWEQVKSDGRLFQEIENVTDNTLGNNPHCGNMSYDNGEEYLNRYRKLFKYASEYKYFNESCFANIGEAYSEIESYGFHDIQELEDSKVHSFSDVIDGGSVAIYKGDTKTVDSKTYYYNEIVVEANKTIEVTTRHAVIAEADGQDWTIIEGKTYTCGENDTTIILATTDKSVTSISYQYTDVSDYDIESSKSIYSIPDYSEVENVDGADGVTSQIINTKKIDLTFYLHFNTIYEKDAQEEIKYIQCRIMPYVEQVIPSTSIMNVHFIPKLPLEGRIFDYTFDNTFN